MRAHPNPWRLQYIKGAIQRELTPSPDELMQMTQREMYSGNVGIHYAMAWSLVYFMLEEGSYAKILVRYFQALRRGKGTEEAYDETFGKIDMLAFEKRWKDFTLNKIR
jgi:hypothetical protein